MTIQRNDEDTPAGMPDYLAEALEVHGLIGEIHWAISRAPRWGYNGYVCIPDDHPWARIEHYDDIPVDVHGGLTFGPSKNSYPEGTGGWIGFDCQHAFDNWGDAERKWYAEHDMEDLYMRPRSEGMFHDIVWTKELVIEEAKRLAMQVASAYETKVVKGEVLK